MMKVKQNKLCQCEKISSGSARISVPPPPALHSCADHHPAHHRPHVVQLAIHHDVSIRADDMAALTDLSVHRSVETLDHVHPKPNCPLFSQMIILSMPHKGIFLVLPWLLQRSQMLLTMDVSPKYLLLV